MRREILGCSQKRFLGTDVISAASSKTRIINEGRSSKHLISRDHLHDEVKHCPKQKFHGTQADLH